MHDQSPPAGDALSASITPNRLLVVRLSAMGDVIHTLPAVTALRRAFPEAHIGWVIEERWSELLSTAAARCAGSRSQGRPLVDQVHLVDTRAWRRALFARQTWEDIVGVCREIRAQQYGIAIDFQGAARSALVARLSAAPVIFGFRQPRENVAAMFYTRQVMAQGAHIVEQNLSLASAVTQKVPTCRNADLPRDEAAERNCEQKFARYYNDGFAIINPGAGWGAKQWPAVRYGEVARRLAEGLGLKSLINFGPGEERLALTAALASLGSARAITCSVTELIALTRRARVFVGGDTGPLHLAAALSIPVVAIFGPTSPSRNGPYGTRSVVLRRPASPTTHARRAEPDEGLLEIKADDVAAAAVSLLKAGHE